MVITVPPVRLITAGSGTDSPDYCTGLHLPPALYSSAPRYCSLLGLSMCFHYTEHDEKRQEIGRQSLLLS